MSQMHKFNLRKRPEKLQTVQQRKKRNARKRTSEEIEDDVDPNWAALQNKETDQPIGSDNQASTSKLEKKIDLLATAFQSCKERIAHLEERITKSPCNQGTEQDIDIDDVITKLNYGLDQEMPESKDRNKQRLIITKEDLEAIKYIEDPFQEFNFESQSAGISIDNITNSLAKVVEKRWLIFIRNWTIVWPEIQSIINKLSIANCIWK